MDFNLCKVRRWLLGLLVKQEHSEAEVVLWQPLFMRLLYTDVYCWVGCAGHSGEQSCLLSFLGQVERFGWRAISVVLREHWMRLYEGTSRSNSHCGQRKGCEVWRAGIQQCERRLALGLTEKETTPDAPQFGAAQEPNEGWLRAALEERTCSVRVGWLVYKALLYCLLVSLAFSYF